MATEAPRTYASITQHFPGTSDSQHSAHKSNSIQQKVWQNPDKREYTIVGREIDTRLGESSIKVVVADVDLNGNGQKTKVAVTSFNDPQDGINLTGAQGTFPACRKPIINHVFILMPVVGYDKVEIIQAIQDAIANEEERAAA